MIADAIRIHSARRLVGESSWLVAGSGCYLVCQWGLLVLVAQCTSPAELGRFGLALAILSPVVTLANMNLRALAATDVGQRFAPLDYLIVRLAAPGAAVLAAAAVAAARNPGSDWPLILVALGLSKYGESLAELRWGLEQRQGRFARVGISTALHGAGVLGGAAVAASLQSTLPSIAWGMVAGRLLVLLAVDLPGYAGVHGASLPPGRTARLVAIAWPLGITGLLASLHTSLPRYVIDGMLDSHALGVFCALAAFPQMCSPLFRAIEQPLAVRMARVWAGGRIGAFVQLFAGCMAGLLICGAGAIFAAWWLAEPVVRWVYSPDYASDAWLLVPMMGLAMVAAQAGMAESALTVVRVTRAQLPMHALSLLVCGTGCMTLVPRWGLAGAVVALVAGKLAFLAVSLPVLISTLQAGRRNRIGEAEVSEEARRCAA